eukprot:gb/GECG01011648.1/.p1 GENE.gb/GECG01011648.1/~~gb/GECG01011648.1/.p1  ORF type:complete len:100 (+),score=5.97 gb/GECG01011648.1/:1-300(+)
MMAQGDNRVDVPALKEGIRDNTDLISLRFCMRLRMNFLKSFKRFLLKPELIALEPLDVKCSSIETLPYFQNTTLPSTTRLLNQQGPQWLVFGVLSCPYN